MDDQGQASVHDVAVACDTGRGWVTVAGQLSTEIEHPVVELTLIAAGGQPMASTMIVDAPPEFQMTLHPRRAERGLSLTLRVEVFQDDGLVCVQEYPFTFEP
jgi:hypothetical protein